jgi:hypothetical protein
MRAYRASANDMVLRKKEEYEATRSNRKIRAMLSFGIEGFITPWASGECFGPGLVDFTCIDVQVNGVIAGVKSYFHSDILSD